MRETAKDYAVIERQVGAILGYGPGFFGDWSEAPPFARDVGTAWALVPFFHPLHLPNASPLLPSYHWRGITPCDDCGGWQSEVFTYRQDAAGEYLAPPTLALRLHEADVCMLLCKLFLWFDEELGARAPWRQSRAYLNRKESES